MITNNNLYEPVMYLIDKSIKRHFNSKEEGGPTGEGGSGKRYIEGVTLDRDDRGRLKFVSGWEYVDCELTYATKGILERVDVTHRITGKHLQIRLIYDDKNWLIEVEPELMDPGTGDPGKIDIPDVTEDYHSIP